LTKEIIEKINSDIKQTVEKFKIESSKETLKSILVAFII